MGPMQPLALQVVAHRGASRVEQENTVAAFRRAVEMGAEGIELDVRMTGNGALVVHHDAEVTPRQGKARVAISTLNVADLPDYVPDLHTALDACAGAWVNIEIKNIVGEPDFDPQRRLADRVVDALAGRVGDANIADWVISSFDRGTIDRVRALAPHLRTAWLGVRVDEGICADLAAEGHWGFSPWEHLITAEVVATAHHHGLAVSAWTCNDPDRMRELMAWGVDALITDVPDVALRVRADAPSAPPQGRD